MAKGLRDIKRSIKATKNMQQITKAMEMVAASKLRRAQLAAEAARPYSNKMREVVRSIAFGTSDVSHPMLEVREVRRTGYLVITSDRGLAGGFNANLLRKTLQTIRGRHQTDDEFVLFVLGRKGCEFFLRRGLQIADYVVGLPDSPHFEDIRAIAAKAVNYFAEEKYDKLYIVYNEFVNPMTQVPVEKQLLPLVDMDTGSDAGPRADYQYEPSAQAVLDSLLPKYAETLIYSALLESKASEFGARMTAMGNASKNSSKLLEELTLQYNRARQAAITQEIAEIVAGANALS